MLINGMAGRRGVLAAAGGAIAALLSGCSSPPGGTGSAETSRPRPAQTELLRRRAVRSSDALLERYDATLAAHPDLEKELRPLREEVAAQSKALGAKPAGDSATPSATPAAVPEQRTKALTELAEAERRTAGAHADALGDAPGELARLLASLSAAGAAHAYLLGRVPKEAEA